MTTLGLCTHFSQADEYAFEYALGLVQERGWQLNICHWLHSPYHFRRDMVQDDLFGMGELRQLTPELLVKLELRLREYYEPRLGDFTDVAFKLCEGQYQVELVRCFRKHLLDLVVMGYPPVNSDDPGEQPIELFAARAHCPLILVGRDGPGTFLLNPYTRPWLDQLGLEEGSWHTLEPVIG